MISIFAPQFLLLHFFPRPTIIWLWGNHWDCFASHQRSLNAKSNRPFSVFLFFVTLAACDIIAIICPVILLSYWRGALNSPPPPPYATLLFWPHCTQFSSLSNTDSFIWSFSFALSSIYSCFSPLHWMPPPPFHSSFSMTSILGKLFFPFAPTELLTWHF